ncbi:ImmA/IrrE family metallo-endopeptidase [Marinicrinis lubricantis]|uniref:ImmA/IrrE family metallo-endopeptidase n=1 Tax=Marinicrinis lubricantis TaxID=2086470 RepID=A0ABW1IQZ4_9BACL
MLRELGNPQPPIPIDAYIQSHNWEIRREELFGPDGYMLKISKKKRSKFFIFLATDPDPEATYNEDIIQKRQFFTLAHELGHILLHGQYLVNSQAIPASMNSVMEVEANWFASRLLMPNYVFQHVVDLVPEELAAKCGVNKSAAEIRLNHLSPNMRDSLIQSVRLHKWPLHSPLEYDPNDVHFYDHWNNMEEVLQESQLLVICKRCGLLHNERTLWGSSCRECNQETLVDIRSIVRSHLIQSQSNEMSP